MTDPFTVTLYGPEGLLVLTRELPWIRSISVALDVSHKLLLQYREQGHETGMVQLQGQGVSYNLC
ncbi:hypothetical protein [Kiloniella spongiae]|uniref:hypothetical protein n=1 Tax=Kiloniella spongiae TaxID=1489064 RepID=UPI0012E01389|nr:hypothetical protein [Kiloniella spongiae]